MRRLAAGGRIDRSREIEVSFDGRRSGASGGHAGLGAARERGGLVGRSFKYHRPRGVLSAGSEEPNALVTVGRRGRGDAEHPGDDAGGL